MVVDGLRVKPSEREDPTPRRTFLFYVSQVVRQSLAEGHQFRATIRPITTTVLTESPGRVRRRSRTGIPCRRPSRRMKETRIRRFLDRRCGRRPLRGIGPEGPDSEHRRTLSFPAALGRPARLKLQGRGSPPTDGLVEAGRLTDEAVLQEQVGRMLADERAHQALVQGFA